MGKTGGRELNYVSDVDVIFVAEPARRGSTRRAALAAATGAGHPPDAGLLHRRPARARCGRSTRRCAPRARTARWCARSTATAPYYERWAKTWEFQALLKARPVGRRPGARRGLHGRGPARWSGRRPARRQLRRGRAGDAPPGRAARARRPRPTASSSSGPGGLRDVEFSVQLLQLVHGRADDVAALRAPRSRRSTRWRSGGYVGREDAATLDESYRLLRTLEHRIQLFRLRRTHLMPTADGRPAPARPRARAPLATPAKAVVAAVAAAGPRGPPHPRAALLPAAAGRRRPAQHRRGPAGARGRPGAAGRARLPRPGRRDAPPRGADRRGEPARRDPAHPAAGDARLVRRRGRPRRRAARLPQGERGARLDPLVPAGCCATRAPPPSGWRTPWPAAATPRTCSSARRSRSRSSATRAGLDPASARGPRRAG